MPRTLSATAVSDLLRQEAADELLFFVTLSHDTLAQPIRVVRDSGTYQGEAASYTWQDVSWTCFPFEVQWVSDTDGPPEARLVVANVDRTVGQAIDNLTTAPTVRIDLVLRSEFDLAVNPRVALDGIDPDPEATADGLLLVDAEVTAQAVSGRLVMIDYTQEVYPNMRATPTRTPGLYA